MRKARAAAETAAKKDEAAADEKKDDPKSAPPAKKTYSDADLKNLTPMPGGTTAPTTTEPAPTPAAATATAAIAEKSVAKKDRDYWFTRMNALLTRLDEDTIARDAAVAREAQYRSEMDASTRTISGEVYVDRILKEKCLSARDETSRLRALVEADKTAIKNLEEEARQADVPPGWLRR